MSQQHEVVGHESGDVDCYLAQYLVIRYLKPDAVPAYEPMKGYDAQRLRDAFSVVDMGDIFIPNKLRFDHHGHSDLPSAARAVWEHLMLTSPPGSPIYRELIAMTSLIDVCNRYDVGGMTTEERDLHNTIGIHAQLSGFRVQYKKMHDRRPSDEECYQFFVSAFERLLAVAVREATAEEWRDKLVYFSAHMDVCALYDGTKAQSEKAQKMYAVVLFHNIEDDGKLHSVGAVTRRTDIRIIDIIAEVKIWLLKSANPIHKLVLEEFETWHLDARGFFGGRTRKGGKETMHKPLVPIEVIAEAIDEFWGKREEKGETDES